MWSTNSITSSVALLAAASSLVNAAPGPGQNGAEWAFIQHGTSGVLALEAIVVSPTLVIFFDRAMDDPLQINNHSAWGALWNLETNTATPLNLITNTFCASGALLSNGSMVGFSLLLLPLRI